MAFKKIANNFWKIFIHFAYKEPSDTAYKYYQRHGGELSSQEFFAAYERSAGLAVQCDAQNFLIVFCNEPNFKRVSGEVVAHECFHTVLAILKARGVSLSADSEEVYAYFLGWLCGQAFNFCYDVENKKRKRN